MSVSEGNYASWRPDARAAMEKIRPAVEKVERIRVMAIEKRAKARNRAFAVVGTGFVVAFALLLSAGEIAPAAIVVAVVSGIAGIIVYLVIHGGATGAYKEIFKREVFGAAVLEALPGMEYSPASMVPQDSFERGGLFSSSIDRYHGEDFFIGKTGATELSFSELHVERKETRTDSKGRTKTDWVTVFKGIYLIADFHKEFRCRVKIEPDVAEANFGWLGRKVQGISRDLVRLESPEFEKAFKVTADDPVAARYLLTPDMQERLLGLRGNWSPDIRAALMDSSMHLAIPKREDWFEPDISVPAHDVAILHGFLVQLMMILNITEALDLNTRIWTKD